VSEEISEAEFDRVIAGTFGRAVPPARGLLDAFQEAGFDAEEAALGVRLMESGRYLGFEDAATTLAISRHMGQRNRANITEAAIQEAAEKYAAQISGHLS